MVSLFKNIFKRKNAGAISKPARSSSKAIILKRDAHNVSRKDISKNAVKVLYKLNEAGYQSYLVGGGVRDILLG
jgi:hypothetical protein